MRDDRRWECDCPADPAGARQHSCTEATRRYVGRPQFDDTSSGMSTTGGGALPFFLAEAEARDGIAKKSGGDTKPSNPKDAIGSWKLPIHLWPATATAMGCIGMLNGMLKYGRSNFRAVGIRPSIYVDAAKRHLDAWFEGEEFDADDGVPHLAAALSCIAIIVDAQAAGKMNDDRMHPGGWRKLVDALTPHVARLKALHAGRTPKHYTIKEGG